VPIDNRITNHVWADPNRMGGIPCFRNTRVPVQTLFDHLRAGDSFDAFLDGYEGVTREQVVAVIDAAAEGWIDRLR
jgi:uncharacterized protein (DUF433 family)